MFVLKILNQSLPESADETHLCSHGAVQLVMGHLTISDESHGHWSVSSSALPLLHSALEDVNGRMIEHCGGPIHRWVCDQAIGWSVTHVSDAVRIASVRVLPSTVALVSDVVVDRRVYREQVLAYAKQVRGFFVQRPLRKGIDAAEQEEWDVFWQQLQEGIDRLESVMALAKK